MEIGGYVTIRDLNDLIRLVKKSEGKAFVRTWLDLNVETSGFILATVVKLSAKKWYLQEIITEDDCNCYYPDDENTMFFTPNWFNTKMLENATQVTWFNELLGERKEFRVA